MLSSRAVSSVIGTVLLVTVTSLGAIAVGTTVAFDPPERPPQAILSLSADAAADRITVVHDGGDPLEPAALAVRISVEGDPITHQPPVPFFAARGFRSGPTGPFNRANRDPWTAGDTASLRLASTNTDIPNGGTVRVRIYSGRVKVAELTTEA